MPKAGDAGPRRYTEALVVSIDRGWASTMASGSGEPTDSARAVSTVMHGDPQQWAHK